MQEYMLKLVHQPYLDYIQAIQKNELIDLPILQLDFESDNYSYVFSQNSLFHNAVQKAGYYSLITKNLIDNLSVLLKGKRCLEVMAGRGVLAHHLNEAGISIVATDNNSWSLNEHSVQKMSGIEAVRHYYDQMDMLILCWPPMTNDAYQIIKEWGTEKPILIGGELGGCCGDDLLTQHFDCELLDVGHVSISGIHDDFYLGHFFS